MRRPRGHVIADESEALLHSLLPSEWIVRPVAKDYGVDFEVEVVDEAVVSGKRIWIQLKGVEAIQIRSKTFAARGFDEFVGSSPVSVDYISHRVATKELRYSLSCSFPLLLFVADLQASDIYWLPLQDEVLGALVRRNPSWDTQQSVMVHIPGWNRLSSETESGFPGLRWYALEPARMYAFSALHRYHHDFRHNAELIEIAGSGSTPVPGSLDASRLRRTLDLASTLLAASLSISVLFDEKEGIDFFRLPIPTFVPQPSLANRLEVALETATTLAARLHKGSTLPPQTWAELAVVGEGMELLSTAIASYQGFRTKFLLTEGSAVWHAALETHGFTGPPFLPMRSS